ncbi:hypothetical protein DWZ61_05005 [Clostridium sp. AF34-10BH]|nr:hypothetical protein DWZ61_05005 [Clostridium sp. AF34-10BH]
MIPISIIADTEDKAQNDSVTVCEEVVSESIEKEPAETVVDETEDTITEEDSETEERFVIVAIVCLFVIFVLEPIILIVESGFFEDVTYDIKESVRKFKEKKQLKTETKTEQKEKTSSDTSKEVFTNTEKMLKNMASSDSKVEYILWAVNYLDQNGKADNTRKLKNYYIPEILKAQAQFKKIKDYGMDEMTTEAKKHYKKIISLAYSVAKAEVKKAASEILMDMDCNADVCENIYKKDGYSSMQEEIQKSHTAEKKKEQTLHAKTISKDTYVFWTSEE